MSTPEQDPSIEHEPHLRPGWHELDPSEEKARQTVDAAAERQSLAERVEHSVWDEPTLPPATGERATTDGLTYSAWLQQRLSETSYLKTWLVTILVVLASGPWAVLGALLGGGQSIFGLVTITIIAPLLEEVMKVSTALWVVEKRPYLFSSRWQIACCALAGGLVFAAIENVLYLNVYIPDASPGMIAWRWTVCVALHSGCSLVASLGLIRIWSETIRTGTRPQLAIGSRYLVAAVILHGMYNTFCVVLESTGFQF